jgi:nucleoside-diphosphate-sugar epimerase
MGSLSVVGAAPERAVVFGGAGYIGQLVTRRLAAAGWRVTVVDRLIHGPEAKIALAGVPSVELLEGDVRDPELVSHAVRGRRAVIMLAALVGEKACDLSPSETWEVNYRAPLAVWEASRRAGAGRFLFASTDSCYGAREGEILDEDSPLAPLTLYARLKARIEADLLERAASGGPPALTILRLATVYGLSPRVRFDLAANLLVREAALKGRCAIFSGDQWRPMVHVSDVAGAFLAALEAPAGLVSGQVLNVGSNAQNIQFKELAAMIRRLVPSADVEIVPADPDLRDYHVNFDKIARLLGFKARVSLPEGLAELKAALEGGFPPDPWARAWRNTP